MSGRQPPAARRRKVTDPIPVPPKDRDKILLLHGQGNSIRQIATATGYTKTKIYDYLRGLGVNTASGAPSPGKPPKRSKKCASSGQRSRGRPRGVPTNPSAGGQQYTAITRAKGQPYTAAQVPVDVKPAPTGLRWNWEHFDEATGTWIRMPGFWYNHLLQAWIPGAPPEDDRDFWWKMEFLCHSEFTEGNKVHPYGAPHVELAQELDDDAQKFLMIMMARDHLKSTFVVVGGTVRTICEKPAVAEGGIMFVTWAPELAEKHFDAVITHFAHNIRILTFYGYLLVDEKLSKRGKKKKFKSGLVSFRVDAANPVRTGELRATTFQGGDITGFHPSIVFLDDIEDVPLSEVWMRRFKTVLLNKLIPAISVRGRLIVTGTIKGYDKTNDIYLLLEENILWTVYRYPAVVDATTGASAMPPMEDVEFEVKQVPVLDRRTKLPRLDAAGRPRFRKHFKIIAIKNAHLYRVTYPERFTLINIVHKRLEMRYGDDGDSKFFSEYQLEATNPAGHALKKERLSFKPPELPHEAPAFVSFKHFANWVHEFGHPMYAWLDPGGKGETGHGIAAVVATEVFGRHVILNCKRIKTGTVGAARWILEMHELWGVTMWGCEANWNQKENFGDVIEGHFFDLCNDPEHPERRKYRSSACTKANNTGEKLQRISTNATSMTGVVEDPVRTFINPDCESFDDFMNEYLSFPQNAGVLGYDLLDAWTSIKIHLYGQGFRDPHDEEDGGPMASW